MQGVAWFCRVPRNLWHHPWPGPIVNMTTVHDPEPASCQAQPAAAPARYASRDIRSLDANIEAARRPPHTTMPFLCRSTMVSNADRLDDTQASHRTWRLTATCRCSNRKEQKFEKPAPVSGSGFGARLHERRPVHGSSMPLPCTAVTPLVRRSLRHWPSGPRAWRRKASVKAVPSAEFIPLPTTCCCTPCCGHFPHDTRLLQGPATGSAAALLPQIGDGRWFFGTRLLLVAGHGCASTRCPSAWVGGPDSASRVLEQPGRF